MLKLDPVADLASENALKVGINPDAEHEASQPFSKLGAKNDLASFLKRLAVSQEITITGAKSDAVAALAQLADDPALLRVVKQRALVERGLELVEGDACPLCDGPWEMALLATHLQEKIAKADAASTALKQLALAIDPLAAHLRAMALDAGKVAEWCEKANPPIDATSLRSHAKALDGGTVDSGPQVWNEGHVWTQIQKHLANDNVFLAAGTLRRYLEFTSTILADNLRARIEYHGNGQYDLGDLWPGVLAAWKARLKEARDSASSWGKNIQDAEALQIESKKRVAATKSEEWMINKAVHYNAWADLQSKEFAAVVSSFQQLLQMMQCPNTDCGEFLCVSPIKGDKEVLRCSCGAVSLNLVPKKN